MRELLWVNVSLLTEKKTWNDVGDSDSDSDSDDDDDD